MTLKQASSGAEIDERLAALLTNVNAVRAIASAVEGTIGPKGLDTMLVDRFGEVIITNDGVTILEKMDVSHPAARMLINVARAQEAEIGDGTTTATVIASSLLGEGVAQVMKGVPVARVIEGVRLGISKAVDLVTAKSRPVADVDDPLLRAAALIAGREHTDIADLVVQAAALVGGAKLKDPDFKFSETVKAEVGAANEVFSGVIVNKERVNKQMPKDIRPVKLLLVDDALEPEEIEDEALATEVGFAKYLEYQENFKANIRKICDLGVNLIIVDRGIADAAEEILTDTGVMVLQRVASKDVRETAELTGARPIKRTGLNRPAADIARYLGAAERAYEDEKLEQVRIIGGGGKPLATVLVGASTEEVVEERERIAKDAAAAVQAAVRGGIVPGGGAVEVALAREIEHLRNSIKGMAAYGVDCVVEALRRPLAQIVANAGFNPLEKLGDVVAAQAERDSDALGIDCETGDTADMTALGVVDPTLVKVYALKAAGEIAEAILRIDTIIKKKDDTVDGAKGRLPEAVPSGDMDF